MPFAVRVLASSRAATAAAFALAIAASAFTNVPPAFATPPSCGNGIVDAGEECDPGSSLGSPWCNTLCRHIAFEADPAFDTLDRGAAEPDSAHIFSGRLACASPGVREGGRDLAPVRVRYRVHLCRTPAGVDAFAADEVRATLKSAAAEYAKGGIALEEEAFVRFEDEDCAVVLGDPDWSDPLVADTPDGVLSLVFVNDIRADAGFHVGGFCRFFGPFCVNAGAFDSLVIHELGHFFGLVHTFECASGTENEDNCEEAGDLLCDTPPDRGPKGVDTIARCSDGRMLDGSCSGSCSNKQCADGSRPDAFNWMSYYDCAPGRFSNGQRDFMRCTLDHELSAYDAGGTPPTTSTSTSTTTLPEPVCGDCTGDGTLTATDALAVLRAGIGLEYCPDWLCDYDGSGSLSASDALLVLLAAVGSGVPPACPSFADSDAA